jgi:8-oxo-dGTP pyrophosphatase MutT (NUDIX family)
MYIENIVRGIDPCDDTEALQQIDVLTWIGMGAPLFRTAKPATPPKHLVAYFVLYDEHHNKLLLVDHVTAKLWLPAGGHVEPDEDPRQTVVRESMEELGIVADFSTAYGADPLFITVTPTRGPDSHTDVSLWYIIQGDSTAQLAYDRREIQACQWFTPQEIIERDIASMDPNMHRFVRKMQPGLAL